MPDNNEIELTQWSRGILDLHDMSLEKKRGIIENFDGNLSVGAQNGAIDIDLFPGAKRNMHSIVSLQPGVDHRTDFDHAAKILRLSGTYQRRFLDDPKPDRDQIGAQNVR